MDKESCAVIEVNNLQKYFPIKGMGIFGKRQYLKAVDDISFSIPKGETFGLVGESGCGKSTVARAIMRLYQIDGGEVNFNGVNIANMDDKHLFPYRKDIQMIFQDPFNSLDPRMTVKQILEEPIKLHFKLSEKERKEKIMESLEKVGLPVNAMGRYPHEFSGGQRQRIGIARALICNPKLVICDEPIAALDVSIQAQVVNMLQDLQEQYGWTYLFIAHDLAMVKYISKKMGVMYLGKMVETAGSQELYTNPLHPYTKGLLNSIPIADPIEARKRDAVAIKGEIPSPLNPPSGCYFRTRCEYCMKICSEEMPALKNVGNSHYVACHLYK